MDNSKVSPTLAISLNKAEASDNLDLIIEITSDVPATDRSLSRQQNVAMRENHFVQDASPIVKTIQEQGGQVVDHAWINQTLRVRVSAKSVELLSELPQVLGLDVPKSIMPELEF